MAPFIKKKSTASTALSLTAMSPNAPSPDDAAAVGAAPPAKKQSKMKRLFGSSRRKAKNGPSTSAILPASSGFTAGGAVGDSGGAPANDGEAPGALIPWLEDWESEAALCRSKATARTGDPAQRPLRKKSSWRSRSRSRQPRRRFSLEEVADLLQANVEVRNRKYQLRTYPNCFVGSEAVDCLVESDVASSRQVAVDLVRQIMNTLRIVEHVTRDHDFEDSYLFYEFVEPEKETAPNYQKLGSGSSRGSAPGGGGLVKMDKYGFLLEDNRCVKRRVSTESGAGESHNGDASTLGGTSHASASGASDEKRWENILGKPPSHNKSSHSSSANLNYSTSQSKVKYYARRGLPDSLRQKAWTVLTGVDLIMEENPGQYDKLVDKAEEEWNKMHDLESAGNLSVSCDEFAGSSTGSMHNGDNSRPSRVSVVLETIERDIHRTFPKHYLFHSIEAGDYGNNGSSVLYGDGSLSENLGSDDEGDDDESSAANEAEDNIVEIAESTGQDTAQVVEAKKRLFNESMHSMSMNHDTSFGGPCNIDGIGLARIESGDNSHVVGRRPSIADVGAGTGNSDNSLDIYGEEEKDEGGGPSNGSRRGSAKSSDDGSEAVGMGHGQGALRRVLRAYSTYDAEVGYCQGMNFIAAMFLTFLSEEEAFWLLVVVMNEEPYKLRELFGEDMAGTHEVLYIAEKLLAQFLPKLSRHMEQETVHISMFVTQWLLTVYTSTFPFDLVARVWDCFLVEGWKVVYRVMLSLLDHASQDVLGRRFEEILNYFRDYPTRVDGQVIMAGSLRIALKRKHIQKHVNEWRRHAGGGEEKSKGSPSLKKKRRASDDTSVSSNTMNSFEKGFPKAPNFMKKNMVPKEVVIEGLTEQLLPIVGTSKFAVILHNVLTPEECSELIDRAEENGFEDASIYDRRSNRIHRNCTRYVDDDPALADVWYERIVHALKDTAFERKLMTAPWVEAREGGGGGVAHRATGLNERLRLLMYRQSQFFHTHNDAVFVRGPDQGDRAGETSFVSVHVYLNQKFNGGSTTFHGRGRHLDVRPRTGSVLLFEHGILHEGQMVTHGKKYVVRTDVMYAAVGDNLGFSSSASGTTLTQQL